MYYILNGRINKQGALLGKQQKATTKGVGGGARDSVGRPQTFKFPLGVSSYLFIQDSIKIAKSKAVLLPFYPLILHWVGNKRKW